VTTINLKEADKIAEPAQHHNYGLEICLKAALAAKPCHQIFIDNLIGLKTRVHWITDDQGVVQGSFAKLSDALGWLLDNEVKFVVVHSERGVAIVALKWLASTEDHEKWLKLALPSSRSEAPAKSGNPSSSAPSEV